MAPMTASRARYRVVALATTLAMVTYLDRVAIGTLAPGIRRDLGLSAVEMGWVFTVFQLGTACSKCQPAGGPIGSARARSSPASCSGGPR